MAVFHGLLQRPLLWPILVYYIAGAFLLDIESIFSQWTMIVIVSLVLALKRFDWSDRTEDQAGDQSLSLLAMLSIASVVVVCLLVVDLNAFRISREFDRENNLLFEVINLHLISSWIAATLIFSGRKQARALILLCAAVVGLSFLVAFFEGRRTSALLPIIFLIYNVFLNGRFDGKRLMYLVILVALLPIIFILVSNARGSGLAETQLATLTSRIFWPAFVLERVIHEAHAFDPQIIQQVSMRFVDALFGQAYTSRTIAFGHSLGLVDLSNYAVGINFGILAELYLEGGIFAVIVGLLLLNSTVYVSTRLCRKAPFGLNVLIPLIYLHGFQMEYAYTITAIVKLTVAILILMLGVNALKRKRVAGERKARFGTYNNVDTYDNRI
ncbi:MAG: hypothetical protein CML99_11575 [Rhodobiaceae bacterium]|nr:hypothetical protein [Rhodobiaceae bacterium]|tara:strand:- start:1034 stop:2185 length:1152 start_codon:yes stop_codon:yes gene_type:complete